MGALAMPAKGTHEGCPYKRGETYAKLYYRSTMNRASACVVSMATSIRRMSM